MNTHNFQLRTGDEVFATLEAMGTAINVRETNFASVDEIVKALVKQAGSFLGMAKLTIRNRTQGCNMVMGIARHRRAS